MDTGMPFAIEMGDVQSNKYGIIHKAGCRDLRDGFPVTSIATAYDEAGWEDGDDFPPVVAPCARR